jgi:MFS family permease
MSAIAKGREPMRAMTQSPPAQAPDPASPWQLRFWTVWIGQTLLLAGSALTQFVLIWWVTQTTQSTSALIAGTALVPGSTFWLAVVCWALGASSFSAGNAMLMALLQSQVPNVLQGRVISLLATVMALASPLGLGLVALLGSSVDVRAVFIVGGSAAAAVCLFGFAAPSLMRIEETLTGQETPGAHAARFD